MRLMTFNEILTLLCDEFDKLILPKSISRSNTNIIYLMFKAIAKGFEIINNICVVVSNKFNPAYCSEDDLQSIASLVGTERLNGSSSGLDITITNNGDASVVLAKGLYHYALDADTTFTFEVLEDTEIVPEGFISIIAMSDEIGSYLVTEQQSIEVTSDNIINSSLAFSCSDNGDLLGTEAETLVDFRKRILNDTSRQDTIIELQTALRNLPYIYDCRCIYNHTATATEYDGYTIPSGNLAIFYSGAPRNEMAEIIASKILCSTVGGEGTVSVKYVNEIFTEGFISFNLIPFKTTEFQIKVNYNINTNIVEESEVKAIIRKVLYNKYKARIHSDFIKENDVYNMLENLNINGFELLSVDLVYKGATVDYFSVPLSRIPALTDIIFNQESI